MDKEILEAKKEERIRKLEDRLQKLILQKQRYDFTDAERNEIALKNPVVITKNRQKNRRNINRIDKMIDKQIKAGQIYREIEDLKREIEDLKNKKIRLKGDLETERKETGKQQTEGISKGDRVYDDSMGIEGTVMSINKNTITVQFGTFKEARKKHFIHKI